MSSFLIQVEALDGAMIMASKVEGLALGLVNRHLDFDISSNLENAVPGDLKVSDSGIAAESSDIFGSQDQLDKVKSLRLFFLVSSAVMYGFFVHSMFMSLLRILLQDLICDF